MKVVLFCGGYGMRMREDAASGPKPMAMIGDRPLLWHVMRYYAHFGHTEFILCLGYGASAVKDYFLNYDETASNDFVLSAGGRKIELLSSDMADWRITFVDTGLDTTIGERLLRVRKHVEDDDVFLANYADVLTDVPLPEMIDFFRRSDATACLLAVPPQASFHVVDVGPDLRVGGIAPADQLPMWQNGGYMLMRREIFEALREGEDLVEHAFGRLAAAGRMLAYPYRGFWAAADTLKERAQLEARYQGGDRPWALWDSGRHDRSSPPV